MENKNRTGIEKIDIAKNTKYGSRNNSETTTKKLSFKQIKFVKKQCTLHTQNAVRIN